jgi:hypothetical protein
MERFHFTISQKLEILELVRTGQLTQLAMRFPRVTQKQIEEWEESKDEMLTLPVDKRNTKYTLHKGPSLKYPELYQVLYQEFKDLRLNRRVVTVELLIEIAEEEHAPISELKPKSKVSLIRRFMEYFNLSIRQITGTAAFREEQATNDELEARESFLREFKRIIVDRSIPIESIFNMDQTGIFYENPPLRTIDFTGTREVPVRTQNGEKKRLTLFSTFNAVGRLYKQMAVIKGTPNARIHHEIKGYDDTNTVHTCQANAWSDLDVLREWHSKIWCPIAQSIQGTKLLILDSYPLHVDLTSLFSKHDTYVLFIPPGLTFSLQPLDAGFFKAYKDELKKLWVKDRDLVETEQDKRRSISTMIRNTWVLMAQKDLSIYWQKAGLTYPYEDVEYRRRNRQRYILYDSNFFDSSFFDSRENSQMTIEENTQMTLEEDYSQRPDL